MQQYRKVSPETHSRISSEITPKVAALLLTTQRVPLLVQPMLPTSTSLRRPAGRKQQRTVTMKINSAVLFFSEPCNFRLLGVPNNLYGLTEMLNVDKAVALVDNSLKMLQKQSILQTQNARFVT